jgi:hypothetical protein
MTTKEMLKNNKLIAIFMISKDGKKLKVPGMIYQQDSYDNLYIKDYLDKEDCKSFKYHKSWDWLMPVVEKIESLGYCVETGFGQCKIRFNNDRTWTDKGNKLASTYHRIVEFIKWYNKNK